MNGYGSAASMEDDLHRGPDPNDPPLPSYDTLMEAEGHIPPPQPTSSSVRPHNRTGSGGDRAPYAPVDYGNPSHIGGQHSAYPDYQGQRSHHRASSGSMPGIGHPGTARRPISDPNDLDFSQLSMTSSNTPPTIPRQASMSSAYAPRQPFPQRQRTADYPGTFDPAASVYSLDTGMSAYTPAGRPGAGGPSNWGDPYGGQSAPYASQQPDFSNPYYAAANDFVGLPPTASSSSGAPSRQMSTGTLHRTNTTASAISSRSAVSLARQPTESVGASSTRRRGVQAAVDLNKPPYTKQYVDDYRRRMKDDPDPEAQFAFSKYLIEAAKKIGDELAERDPKLGRKYRDALLQESLRNIKKLAEGKIPYADAQFFLANLYGTGQLGLQVDHEKAYYLYLMASKLNHPAATYRSAVCNEIGAGTKKDPGRAVLFYRKAAALGDTAAMYKLSMILLGGLLGQPRNPREAIVWLTRAASQADEDNPHALHELALLHERPNNGGVVPHDPNTARELFLQAAGLGYAPAQFKLGACHEFGHLGCPIDPRKSIAWYTRAAEKGDSEAELALSGWYLTGSEGVLKQSDTEAYLWGRKAANKGLAKAEYAVGYYTETGIGVKQDVESAKRWYMRAAGELWLPRCEC
ncbi:hypothetical protein BD324DRAFT_617863 [Kockovaella imperatae]|uniref:HCP-like protein n=1 Tax=Kockovaella imperatae TaxID=4999 RepID=A0A1Y1UN51_9TREE|nr:hypothetical protein BD324DRAFT_617863 [Kockovaella imperatae]ORX38914.1 hypothetical protein BD324DRAFT_617863 [Kockovaella imperatae]